MNEEEIVNARIESTTLGTEDHGILTCMLYLDFGGWSQGFGGFMLDKPIEDENGKFLYRQGSDYGMEFINSIMKVVGVEKWEQLPGKYIRVKRPVSSGLGRTIESIGHIIKDNWFNPKEDLKHLINDKSI